MSALTTVLQSTQTASQADPEIGALHGLIFGAIVVTVTLYVLYKNRDKKRCPDCATEYNPDFDRSDCFDCGGEMEYVSQPRLIDRLANIPTIEVEHDE